MRLYHRWGSLIAALFLLAFASRGVVLQVQKLTGSDADAGDHGEKDRTAALTTAMPSPALRGAHHPQPLRCEMLGEPGVVLGVLWGSALRILSVTGV